MTTDNPPIDKLSKYAITVADFKLFLTIWNQQQKQTTPDVHYFIAGWLEEAWRVQDQRLLLMAFRSCGKSTIVGLFAAWLLYKDPSLRILALAADSALAGKMVRNVKRMIERHPLTKDMRPKEADQWASDRFTVKRPMELRDPSMLARGITSNITGSRADVIICDDVEVPTTCDSADKRENLRELLSELSFVLVPNGTMLYVGTPHHYYTIYADAPYAEIGEEQAFLNGFKRLKVPVINKAGDSVWPERFSLPMLEQQKRQGGMNKFTSQMMLQPVNIAQGRLNPDLLSIYDEQLDYVRELKALYIGGKKMLSASAWWDPAFGSAKGDHSVLAVIFTDEEGLLYLQHLEYIKLSETSEEDEATAQCKIIAKLAKQLCLPCLTVEINGIGRFLPGLLRNELASAKVPCTVQEASSTRAKDLRILEAFDTVLAAERLKVHSSVQQTPFFSEMREWRPKGAAGGASKGHDDGLDAVAGAIAQKPMRLKRLYGSGAQSWMGNNNAHQAKTEFEV